MRRGLQAPSSVQADDAVASNRGTRESPAQKTAGEARGHRRRVSRDPCDRPSAFAVPVSSVGAGPAQ